jgi:3-deoxy-7-phosphoheptulonate synthase
MIIVMKSEATKEQVGHVVDRIRQLELTPHVIVGTERTVIAIIGDERPITSEMLETSPGVEKVMPVLAPYKMASLEMRHEPSRVALGRSGVVGGRKVGLIAGPCTVESRECLLEIAHAVKEAGAVALRGGAFKPRTNPYSFQGLAEEGLQYLAEAREATGLAIITEVMCPEQVGLVARYADVLQIGTRNMQNYDLLKAVGQQKKPVLLKRGMSATIEEWLLAAEYVLSQGNESVMLCERGIRTFEQHTRFTLPLASVPHLKELTHLPVLVDPSHGTGRRSLVAPMARAAVACGADGVLIEVHRDPEASFSDGAQTITPQEFADIVTSCRKVAEAIGREV